MHEPPLNLELVIIRHQKSPKLNPMKDFQNILNKMQESDFTKISKTYQNFHKPRSLVDKTI